MFDFNSHQFNSHYVYIWNPTVRLLINRFFSYLILSYLPRGTRQPAPHIDKLQMTQNSAARLIMRQRRRDHITPVLIALHWLPIRFRVMYKLLVLTFLAIHNLAPAYITDLISIYEPGRQLRSASRALLS